ncbi:MAG: hypothetical protein LBM62_01295 [Mediterranea sp.]|jgi:hypothetical protein|nr:hypothetical protein [Mediterranea sp.]
MQTSDYNEVILRIEHLQERYKHTSDTNQHSISVTASKNTDGDSIAVTVLQRDREQETPRAAVMMSGEDNSHAQSIFLTQLTDITALATYFQQGIHTGVDVMIDPDVNVYDSLLTARLAEKGLNLPHRLEYLHRGATVDSSFIYTDTLGVYTTAGYVPSDKALHYQYAFDIYAKDIYRLTLEPFDLLVLRQMSGIVATSLVIFVILIVAFWLLIHTILQQRTLDEMKSDFTNNITHELKTPIAVAYAANDALLHFGKEKTPRCATNTCTSHKNNCNNLADWWNRFSLSAWNDAKPSACIKKVSLCANCCRP